MESENKPKKQDFLDKFVKTKWYLPVIMIMLIISFTLASYQIGRAEAITTCNQFIQQTYNPLFNLTESEYDYMKNNINVSFLYEPLEVSDKITNT